MLANPIIKYKYMLTVIDNCTRVISRSNRFPDLFIYLFAKVYFTSGGE